MAMYCSLSSAPNLMLSSLNSSFIKPHARYGYQKKRLCYAQTQNAKLHLAENINRKCYVFI
jgi:hypothetical protein